MSPKNLEIEKIILCKTEVLILFVFIWLSKLIKPEIHEVLLTSMNSIKIAKQRVYQSKLRIVQNGASQ